MVVNIQYLKLKLVSANRLILKCVQELLEVYPSPENIAEKKET